MNVKTMVKNAIIAALYVALTYINPLSFGVVQFRVANLLAAVPYYKREYSVGFVIGAGLANLFSSFGLVDVAFGMIAASACYALLAYGPLRNLPDIARYLLHALIIALIIGTELVWFASVPVWMAFVSLFVGTWVIVALGGTIIKGTALKNIL